MEEYNRRLLEDNKCELNCALKAGIGFASEEMIEATFFHYAKKVGGKAVKKAIPYYNWIDTSLDVHEFYQCVKECDKCD